MQEYLTVLSLCEEGIERAVERAFDILDTEFMREGNTWTQDEYAAKGKAIHAEAGRYFAKLVCRIG